MAATNTARDHSVVVDDDLAERLRLVADELGGRRLPLRAIVRAILTEAAEHYEKEAALAASGTSARAQD
jgi:hypothetical protein